MISFAQPLPIGNAVRLVLAPAPGTLCTRVLRRVDANFAGFDDPNAFVAYEGGGLGGVDFSSLTNGTPYYYCAYDFDGAAWTGSPVISCTPLAAAEMDGPDPLSLVRDRLDAGLLAEVQAGNLQHDNDHIPVLTAPPNGDNLVMPAVSVHLANDSPAVRAIGELITSEGFDPVSGEWLETQGWWSAVRLDIGTWVPDNADVRIALRLAIKKIIIGNLPVFAAAGLQQVEISMQDTEDFQSYNSAMYQTVCSFSCLAPSVVAGQIPSIAEIDVNLIES